MYHTFETLVTLSMLMLARGTPQNNGGLSRPLRPTTTVINFDDAEIKEFHFHVYFFQTNSKSVDEARRFWNKIQRHVDNGYFKVRLFHFNDYPIGPHLIGNYEVWCPIEYFGKAYSFMLLNRGSLSILIHPLTPLELTDHTDRAAWIGQELPLDTEPLCPKLNMNPSQYHNMCLGYSSKNCTRPHGLSDACVE
uniref:DOPA 4,5-dioxygenase n=1 Tax=Romanomermis culicivorax TaxID=13658 RepID=A0A915KZ72_ROMCU